MKTKQAKDDLDKSTDEETLIEPKTRARKKASDGNEEDKTKPSDEPKTSKEPKKTTAKPKTVVKKRPLGIRKALRSKKASIKLDKIKNVIKQTAKRGRKPAKKIEPANSQDKDTVPLIPPSEIKKEPEETSPNSRSCSPKAAGRRPRVSSDMMMMKTVLADAPSNLLLGPRTSPYSMRSERSNSPSTFETKNLRSGKPRKVKNNLLNEVVIKEQKKRRRLLSDSKPDVGEGSDECKKLKRGRSCSRDGSEISKCSDITESDISLSEPPTDNDKELNKKSNKPKTDLDIDIETNIQISTDEKVPSLNTDSKLAETKPDTDSSSSIDKTKKKINMSLKRSTSLDSDNNNSNRIKIENFNSSDIEDKLMMKTDNDTLFEDRSSILNSMSKTFNSKDLFKSVRKSRRGGRGKGAGSPRSSTGSAKNGVAGVAVQDDDKTETIETLSKEIDDLINDLDKNINDQETDCEPSDAKAVTVTATDENKPKLNVSKALTDSNIIAPPESEVKEKEKEVKEKETAATDKIVAPVSVEASPAKSFESENIKLHYDEDSVDKPVETTPKVGITYNIPKLMGRLKEFEEFDKIRQRQETKPTDNKQVMVINDVVLIPKSGADVRQLKDIQSVKSPEKAVEKENLLSCFENNSAISILKRDPSRKSIDIDLPNSVTLIKRNSVSSRKESTSSNHSRESDAISIFEKSLGKDVTLTEIKKTADKQSCVQPDLNQLATLQPTTPTAAGMGLDSKQISITPRITGDHRVNSTEIQITKRKSLESLSRKSSESAETEEKMAVLEKIKSPPHGMKSPAISITATPVAVKSPEVTPMETEAAAPPLDVKTVPTDGAAATEVAPTTKLTEAVKPVESKAETPKNEPVPITEVKPETATTEVPPKAVEAVKEAQKDIKPDTKLEAQTETVVNTESIEVAKPAKARESKSARNSTDTQPGPSCVLLETPESQKRKENVLRTLGLLTHKAANEAKIEKLREKERINALNKGKSKSDSTGTLKTVIKLNRGAGERDRKKFRKSLKITFKSRGKPPPELGDALDEDAYYTIERREAVAATTSEGGSRKTHHSNRLNHVDEAAPEPEPTETLKLVIPEKASSFSIHPGRVCMDQCFYCGGKFGLYDTPCHIAQMKSSERQRKVLDNEEKLTVDSCLCDACYRHVDRRANCPSYRRRPPKMHSPPANMPGSPPPPAEGEARALCHVAACAAPAPCSIRRKWLIKMRPTVNKVLRLQGDYPGLHTIPLCAAHHAQLAPLRACALCRRHPTKLHALHAANKNLSELNPLIAEHGVPVQLTELSVLCKMCRCYCSLLARPGDNDRHERGYRKKLLQIHNVAVPAELEHDVEDPSVIDECSRNKAKKSRTKKKSSDTDKPDRDSSEQTTETSSPEKEREIKQQPLEEDIETLISTNKIPVPAKQNDAQSDGSENEQMDTETPLTLPIDKQTELQYLLQKQNNPAQFLHGQPKQKHIQNIKLHNTITKPGQQQRIQDKNAKRIQKIGQIVIQKDKLNKSEEVPKESMAVLTNLSLNEECTIESIPTKKSADINTLKNKWQMSESFTQVKKNLSELSKKLPPPEKDKKLDAKYSNPVKRLETNPSISVRELFPGEEEMSLQCNIEFNNVKGVTPEGWEKCNSLIQYDSETKKLWTELQRPYGNQSSFLRHLILLEKYFRRGDLVLSPSATPNAANYSDSVQSRLRAYDNVVTDAPRRSEPAISLMVTETPPKRPEQSISLIEFRKKPSINGKSLLKTNNTDEKEPKKIMPPPAPSLPKAKTKEKSKNKPLPPELIAINAPNSSRKAMHNVLHNIQQLVKGVSASDPIEVASAPLPAVIPAPAQKEAKEKKEPPKKKSLTSKPWRPTLMPITQENLAKIAREPTQVAVDGRKLPSLVQVMSSGKRYHITLQDYNKMCVMRREKLQQLQDGKKEEKQDGQEPNMVEQWLRGNKDAKHKEETTVVTELQPSAMLGNGGTVLQNIINAEKEPEKKEMPELNQISSNAATILKSVGLKNITIAPITPKTATVTSPALSSPALLVSSPLLSSPLLSSTPLKLPQLGPAVSITSEPLSPAGLLMPKIPKSLTVIPQGAPSSNPAADGQKP